MVGINGLLVWLETPCEGTVGQEHPHCALSLLIGVALPGKGVLLIGLRMEAVSAVGIHDYASVTCVGGAAVVQDRVPSREVAEGCQGSGLK